MHALSEDVRELTLNFQEDAHLIEGGMSALIRTVDAALKALPQKQMTPI